MALKPPSPILIRAWWTRLRAPWAYHSDQDFQPEREFGWLPRTRHNRHVPPGRMPALGGKVHMPANSHRSRSVHSRVAIRSPRMCILTRRGHIKAGTRLLAVQGLALQRQTCRDDDRSQREMRRTDTD
jgi:hypothetical protein